MDSRGSNWSTGPLTAFRFFIELQCWRVLNGLLWGTSIRPFAIGPKCWRLTSPWMSCIEFDWIKFIDFCSQVQAVNLMKMQLVNHIVFPTQSSVSHRSLTDLFPLHSPMPFDLNDLNRNAFAVKVAHEQSISLSVSRSRFVCWSVGYCNNLESRSWTIAPKPSSKPLRRFAGPINRSEISKWSS